MADGDHRSFLAASACDTSEPGGLECCVSKASNHLSRAGPAQTCVVQHPP